MHYLKRVVEDHKLAISKDADMVNGKYIVSLNKAFIPNHIIFENMIIYPRIKAICYFLNRMVISLLLKNRKYISNLKENLRNKTGVGLVNKVILYLPEMHLSLPSNVSSEKVSNGSFNNTGKYSFCGTLRYKIE